MSEASGRRGLGRGLSALLGEVDAPGSPSDGSGLGSGTPEVPIELLRRNPDQPRRSFAEAELAELAGSIREKGILQPLLVRPAPGAPGEYQIIAGERRWRASQLAGLRTVPVVIRGDLDDLDVLEIGVIENIQRADLKPLEEAQAYKTLIDRFGRTQEDVAKTVGKSRSHVANSLRLLSLPDVITAPLDAGEITAGHARAIASAPNPDRLVRQIIDKGMSVRQAEALARDAATPGGQRAQPAALTGKSADTIALESDLGETLGLEVIVDDKGGRGEVRIRYSTLEELDSLCQRLSR